MQGWHLVFLDGTDLPVGSTSLGTAWNTQHASRSDAGTLSRQRVLVWVSVFISGSGNKLAEVFDLDLFGHSTANSS